MPKVVIITDGSADNMTGSGGWAAVVRLPSELIEIVGYAEGTTSNRMELTAAIEGLRSIKEPSEIDLIADSAYVLNAIKHKWYERWFTESRVKERPNMDLWHQLAGLLQYHTVTPIKIKGHSGDYWNERADRLADHARRNLLAQSSSVDDWVDGERCTSNVRLKKQCKLHMGHTGPHTYRGGMEAYGTQEPDAEGIPVEVVQGYDAD